MNEIVRGFLLSTNRGFICLMHGIALLTIIFNERKKRFA